MYFHRCINHLHLHVVSNYLLPVANNVPPVEISNTRPTFWPLPQASPARDRSSSREEELPPLFLNVICLISFLHGSNSVKMPLSPDHFVFVYKKQLIFLIQSLSASKGCLPCMQHLSTNWNSTDTKTLVY